ncbi:MAG: riboflavin synthase [Methylococcales bacterium]
MFTGIIQAVGLIAAIDEKSGDCRLTVDTGDLPLNTVELGDSIAVNGVCLTVVSLEKQHFCADVSRESLSRTTLRNASLQTPVNLELALTPSTRMGGHIVSGHVDGVAKVVSKQEDARSVRFEIEVPDNISKYIAEKGSICIDGISLTVNSVNGNTFDVNIVPHTLKVTTMGQMTVGYPVNIEVDLIARHLERLLLGDQAAQVDSRITNELLAKSGYFE